MTENEFEVLARQALLQANRQEWEPILASSPAFSPSRRYLFWEKRLLAAPFRCAKRQTRPLWKKALQAAACFALLVSVAIGGVMAASPTARAWVQQVFVEWLGEYARFSFGGSAGQETGAWKTTWLPEGFELVEQVNTQPLTKLVYENNDGAFIRLIYAPAVSAVFGADSEYQDYQKVFVNGTTAYLLQATAPGKSSYLIWTDTTAEVAFKLSTTGNVEDLISLAEGVQKIK